MSYSHTDQVLDDVAALPGEISAQLSIVDIHPPRESNGLDVSRLIQRRWPEALLIFVTANVLKIPDDFSGGHGVIGTPFFHAGVAHAIRYLAESVFDPPSSAPRPSSLVASPNLERRWAKA